MGLGRFRARTKSRKFSPSFRNLVFPAKNNLVWHEQWSPRHENTEYPVALTRKPRLFQDVAFKIRNRLYLLYN